MNVRVTANGSDTLPDSLLFLREREGGARDSLFDFGGAGTCFGELPGRQRILVLRDSVVADSSDWFGLPTADCCHGEAAAVNL